MFDWLKKEKEIHLVSYDEIIERKENDTKLGRKSAFFINSQISEETEKKLKEQGISIKHRNNSEAKCFEIFW